MTGSFGAPFVCGKFSKCQNQMKKADNFCHTQLMIVISFEKQVLGILFRKTASPGEVALPLIFIFLHLACFHIFVSRLRCQASSNWYFLSGKKICRLSLRSLLMIMADNLKLSSSEVIMQFLALLTGFNERC